jgi:phospholipid/cholesterol/gamma-HCH transport system substrate-binding protein
MNSISNKRPITVAFFILAGLCILIAAIFTIGMQKQIFAKTIVLKVIFEDVNGLKIGNNVWLSGMKIGTVKDMYFANNSNVEVTLVIEKWSQKHISVDSKAKIGGEGFIGNKIVVIQTGVEKVSISNGSIIRSEKSTSTEDMLSTLQSNNVNILEITSNFKKISKKILDGDGTLGALITDSTISNDLRSTLISLKKASINGEKAMVSLNDFSSKLNHKGSFANDIISDSSMVPELKATISLFQKTALSASEFTENLNKASQQLNNTNSPIGMLLNDEAAKQDLKIILQNIKISSEKLDENLEAMQHSFWLKGYFKQKEKEEKKQKN